MTHIDNQNSVFKPGKARWLQKRGGKDLDSEQQALLLALTQVEAEMGRELSEEELTAIETLAEELEGFDLEAIRSAVHEMVNRPADPDRQIPWPEIKKRKD